MCVYMYSTHTHTPVLGWKMQFSRVEEQSAHCTYTRKHARVRVCVCM